MGFYFNLFTDSSDLRHISEGISIKGPSQDNSDYAATDKTLNNISEGISKKNGQVKTMVTMQPLIKH